MKSGSLRGMAGGYAAGAAHSPDQLALILAQRTQAVPGQVPLDPAQLGSLAAQGTGTYSISSLATRANGSRAQIRSVIRIGSGGSFGQLYLPLSWRVGESD